MVLTPRGASDNSESDETDPVYARRRDAVQSDPAVLRIQLLGGFRVSVGPRAIDDSEWYLRKAKQLVKLLATAPNRRLHRGQLMDTLWPDLDIDAGTNNLHKVLHIARRVLEPDLPAKTPSAYLHMQGELVSLAADRLVWIDVEAFREAVDRARQTGDLDRYEEALRLYRGDLLPEDRYDDWAIRRRDSLRDLRVGLLLEAAGLHERRGDVERAIESLQQLVDSEPAHEEAQMHLIRLLATSGHRQLALRQYQQLCNALQEELHVEPSAALKQLYNQIVSADPFPGAAIPDSGDSPLVGRVAELTQMEREIDALFAGHGNIVAAIGGYGLGKSRLVSEALDRAARRGAITLWGAAYRLKQSQPYHLFSILLDGFALRVPPENLRALLGPSEHILAGLAPNLARVLDHAEEDRLPPPGDPSLIAAAVLDLFAQMTRYAPVALVLDDLHFADDASLQLLQDFSGLLPQMPVLALAAYRDAEIVPGSALDRLHATLERDRSATILRLQEIGFQETGQLAARLLRGAVDVPVVETIYRLAGGNLHYTEEAVQALQGRRRIVQNRGKWQLRSGIAVTWGREQLRAKPESGDYRLARLLRASP